MRQGSEGQTTGPASTTDRFVAQLYDRGIRLWVEGDQLKIRAPKGSLTPAVTAEVTARKAEIISFLRDHRTPELPRLVMAPGERHAPFPLLDMQEAYWLGQSDAFALGRVNAHLYSEYEFTEVDLPRLNRAVQRLIARHEVLRVVVLPSGQQQILPEAPAYTIEPIDLRAEAPAAVAETLRAAHEQMSRRGPRTDRWPLFECRAYLLPDRRVRFHVSLSLLILDLLSVKILSRELRALYRDPDAALPPLELSFRDYVLATMAYRKSEGYRRSEEYWRNRVADMPPAPELPLARTPASVKEARFVRRSMKLDEATWARLRAHASEAGVFAASGLCAAYCAILARWSKNPRFTLNLLESQRLPLHPQVADVAGNFSSTALMAVDTTTTASFEDLARQVHQRRLSDRQHNIVSGVSVLREINRVKGTASQATMPVVFNNLDGVLGEDQDWLDHEVHGSLQTPQIYLDHQVMPRGRAVELYWDAVEEMFPPGVLDAMFQAYGSLLRRLAEAPSAWKLSPSKLIQVAPALRPAHGHDGDGEAASLGTLHDRVFARGGQQPERPAVISSRRTLSYGELMERAGAAAAWLREAGARPNQLVGVVMEKGWEQTVAALGINAAGAAYLPIDASLPSDRVRSLLERGEVQLVLTQGHVDTRLEWPDHVRRLRVDEMETAHAGDRPADGDAASALDLAYVIFTSGSTGQPKGVMIDHRGAVNTIVDINQRFGVTERDRVLAVSSLGFDLSVYDIFGLLSAGGSIVVPDAGDTRDPACLAGWIKRHGITIWNSVPATMEMVVEHLASKGERLPSSLRLVLLSGDWIPITLPDRIRRLGEGISVISLGGATEASIWSIFHPIERVDPAWTSIPYGKPLAHQRVDVLNHELEPCPTWVPGELYISGVGVALGYWRDKEQTDERFIRTATGVRLYRTGDWGRLLPDGNIEFLGREDLQVKVHGFRIELGEIEGTLQQHPHVRAAAVAAIGERVGSKSLVAYVVPQRGASVEPGELRSFLERRLPWYMVPTTYMPLAQLPLSANGKVDRRRLPAPQASCGRRNAERVAPRSPLERRLLDIWETLLDARPIGVTDHFFELGGNSLLAVRLSALVRERLGQELSVSRLFEAPTIADMAASLERADAGAGSTLVSVQPGGTKPPLFLVHPVGGNALCYFALARCLGPEQPVFAFAARGLDGKDRPLTQVKEMAALYVAEIRAAKPRGPYLLGGWSMGGVIATEMAAQLEEQGDVVEGVVLFDSLLPPPDADTTTPALVERFLHDLGAIPEVRRAARERAARGDVEQCLEQALESVKMRNELSTANALRLFDVFAENMRALNRFLLRPCAAPLLSLQAATFSFEPGWRRLGPCLSAAAAKVEVHDVACDHFTILSEPHVNDVAERVTSFLAALPHTAAPARATPTGKPHARAEDSAVS